MTGSHCGDAEEMFFLQAQAHMTPRWEGAESCDRTVGESASRVVRAMGSWHVTCAVGSSGHLMMQPETCAALLGILSSPILISPQCHLKMILYRITQPSMSIEPATKISRQCPHLLYQGSMPPNRTPSFPSPQNPDLILWHG